MKAKSIVIIVIHTVLQLLDGLLTWIGSPNLKLEANPLVRYFGMGWAALFISNFIVFAIFCVASYFSFSRYQTRYFDIDGGFAYISMLFYNRPDRFRRIFGFSKNINYQPVLAMGGYIFCYGLIAGRLALVFGWLVYLLNLHVPVYTFLKQRLSRPDLILTILVELFCIYLWCAKEYRKNEAWRNSRKQIPLAENGVA